MAFLECNHNNSIRPIKNLLIANRGEIASRIAATARSYSISPRGIFSDADRSLRYLDTMDRAYGIGESHPSTSYLNIEKVIGAAIAMECDAVAPGYGFLSENAPFAQAVIDAGLTFVGPPPRVIAAMGSKARAKEIAELAGVPVLKSVTISSETKVDSALVEEVVNSIAAPYLVKAVFGGGGRGMRLVPSANDLIGEIETARREALSSFGDATVYVETYIEEPRHLEVQLVGDHYGNVATLFERECSIQRRFQKVIEEAPSPSIDDRVRERLFAATKALAGAIGYSNLGTAEFVVTRDNDFYFLEVNTRIQVEHRVTEAITGIDLVGIQLEIAMGYSLPRALQNITPVGHAIEARIYGEATDQGFMPSSGKIKSIDLDHFDVVDQSYFVQDEVSIFYDSMVSKVVSLGRDRNEAISKLASGLLASHVAGISTNIDLLRDVVRDEKFRIGTVSTNYLSSLVEDQPRDSNSKFDGLEVIAAAVFFIDRARSASDYFKNLPLSFRNLPSKPLSITLSCGEGEIKVQYRATREDHLTFESEIGEGEAFRFAIRQKTISLERSGLRYNFAFEARGDIVVIASQRGSFAYEKTKIRQSSQKISAGSLTTKMAGTITKVTVTIGDEVKAGDTVAVIEAMKIEQPIVAPVDGEVEEIYVTQGQRVDRGVVVAKIGT
ncbi:MAG: acetyl/propionyl-CoA carboxylase subunit alpha [Actinomycetota bacterium]|nr:acetyl/propionyl-CoA carboxylase subunit alpha [Actinomycetota bacterium]